MEFQYNNKKHSATGYTSFELNNKDGITKTGNFPWETTEKLENSEIIDEKGKRSYEKTVQPEKIKLLRVEARKRCVVGSKNI